VCQGARTHEPAANARINVRGFLPTPPYLPVPSRSSAAGLLALFTAPGLALSNLAFLRFLVPGGCLLPPNLYCMTKRKQTHEENGPCSEPHYVNALDTLHMPVTHGHPNENKGVLSIGCGLRFCENHQLQPNRDDTTDRSRNIRRLLVGWTLLRGNNRQHLPPTYRRGGTKQLRRQLQTAIRMCTHDTLSTRTAYTGAGTPSGACCKIHANTNNACRENKGFSVLLGSIIFNYYSYGSAFSRHAQEGTN